MTEPTPKMTPEEKLEWKHKRESDKAERTNQKLLKDLWSARQRWRNQCHELNRQAEVIHDRNETIKKLKEEIAALKASN